MSRHAAHDLDSSLYNPEAHHPTRRNVLVLGAELCALIGALEFDKIGELFAWFFDIAASELHELQVDRTSLWQVKYDETTLDLSVSERDFNPFDPPWSKLPLDQQKKEFDALNIGNICHAGDTRGLDFGVVTEDLESLSSFLNKNRATPLVYKNGYTIIASDHYKTPTITYPGKTEMSALMAIIGTDHSGHAQMLWRSSKLSPVFNPQDSSALPQRPRPADSICPK